MATVTERNTLKELLENPLIEKIHLDAIRNIDLTKEEYYTQTIEEIHNSGRFHKDCLLRGFTRLYKNAETIEYYHRIYKPEECGDDPQKETVNLAWFPSDDPAADERPYILMTPGGGYFNEWSLTEGWPVAAIFNECGYHALILSYRVGEEEGVIMPKPLDDIAQAIRYIRDHEKEFHLKWDKYITCGFSAGGNLMGLWSTDNHGYVKYGLPKPQATFPIYPVISWKLMYEVGGHAEDEMDYAQFILGMPMKEAIHSSYNIDEHVSAFPPCHLFLAAEDTLVDPEHSKLLKRALDAAGIPCEMEIGPTGGHGFADGSGMCMEGWPGRAIAWYEQLQK